MLVEYLIVYASTSGFIYSQYIFMFSSILAISSKSTIETSSDSGISNAVCLISYKKDYMKTRLISILSRHSILLNTILTTHYHYIMCFIGNVLILLQLNLLTLLL